jgi:uncharacterized membrane protein
VAMVLFIVASLLILAAVGTWKIVSFLGIIVGGTTTGLWVSAQHVNWSLSTFSDNSRFGVGLLCVIFGLLLAVLSLLLPKKHERKHFRRSYD